MKKLWDREPLKFAAALSFKVQTGGLEGEYWPSHFTNEKISNLQTFDFSVHAYFRPVGLKEEMPLRE